MLLLIYNEDNTCDSVGKLFGNSPRSISKWVNKVNESLDVETLRDKKKSGRKPRLTEYQLSELKLILQLPPESNGVSSNIWDGKSLSWFIEKKYGVLLKNRRCQYLFNQLGFSLKRPRPVVAKCDENKKNFEIELEKKVESQEYEVYFEEECHFKLTLTIIRAWFLAGITPQIKSPVARHKISVFGAMGMNGQLIVSQSEIFNAITFKLFLEKIISNAYVGLTKEGHRKKIL